MARSPTTVAKGAGRTITFEDQDDWGSGFIGAVTIGNTTDIAVTGWTIAFDLANAITNIWNAEIVSHVGTHYVIRNLAYDATIPAGGTVSFGFQADGGSPILPTSFTLDGTSIGGTSPPPPPPPPPPLPTLAIGDASVTETGAASLAETFAVTLSAASASPVTVAFHTVDGTA
ncbi:MAG: cellulose binding domain-containing protein, partial [Rhodospirillales bacterium]|nr:cellulose binding domain-containing protein [Rhodospirillales bacterium]